MTEERRLNANPFDMDLDDQAKIEQGEVVPCRICETAFGQHNFTTRYCSDCKKAFCDKHGNFAYTTGKCTICGSPMVRDLKRQIRDLEAQLLAANP